MRPHAPPSPALSSCMPLKPEDSFSESYDSISQIMSQSIGQDPMYDMSQSKYNTRTTRMQNLAVKQNQNYTHSLRFSPQPSVYSDDGSIKGYPYATPMASPPMPHTITTNPIISRPNLRSHSKPATKPAPKPAPRASATTAARGTTVSGRVEKSPSPKKKPAKKGRGGAPRATHPVEQINVPLSKLAKNYPNIHIADIPSFIVRDESERHDEIKKGKSPGKVKRPMNAFMLYRKAYQNVAKAYCTGDNHQIVSAVCGRSWSIESPAIKEKFINWSTTERSNHQLAYPSYRFAPGKIPAKGDDDEDCDADGEIDDEVDAMEDVVEESPSKKRLDRLQKQHKQPAVAAPKIKQPQIMKPVRAKAAKKSINDDNNNNTTTENTQNELFPTAAQPQQFYYSSQESHTSDYPLAGVDPMADSFNQSMYAASHLDGHYGHALYEDAAHVAVAEKPAGFMMLPDEVSLHMAAWNPPTGGLVDAPPAAAPAPAMDESLFDQAWVYPYGQDSMTMLDSMMNVDPQMSYLTSSWVQDDVNIQGFV